MTWLVLRVKVASVSYLQKLEFESRSYKGRCFRIGAFVARNDSETFASSDKPKLHCML